MKMKSGMEQAVSVLLLLSRLPQTGFFDVRGYKPAIACVSVLLEEADENISSSRFGRILTRDEGRFYPDEAFG